MYLDVKQAAVCLALLALVGCGALDRASVAPTLEPTDTSYLATLGTPTPPMMPATAPPPTPGPTSATPWPAPPPTLGPTSATPWPTPTGTPTQPVTPVELPPTPKLPFELALGQFAKDALLYVNSKGFLMLSDGLRELWLTSDDTICDHELSSFQEQGAWSPDGQYVAISCSHERVAVVAILNTRTGTFQRVDTGASDISPVVTQLGAWSPTGSTFLILTRSADRSRISVVDAPTGRVQTQNLFEDASLTLYTAWSPDGTRIAIYTGNGLHGSHGSSKLYLVNADGSNLYLLTDVGSFDQCGSLEWSHDGRFILVKIDDGSYCVRISADTGTQESVAFDSRIPTAVRWSPDGRWYLVKQQPQWLLYRADGTLAHRFDPGTNYEFSVAAWLPDSQRIVMGMNEVVSSTTGVIMADVEGRQTVLATFSYARISTLAVASGSGLLAVPLGSHIVILDSQGRMQADVEGQLSGWWPQH